MQTAILSSKGQLVIPKSVRQDANVAEGTVFSVSVNRGEIRLRPVLPPQATSLNQVAGCLAQPGRQLLDEQQTKAKILARLKAKNAA